MFPRRLIGNDISWTYLGRKATEEGIPKVAKSKGKVFVEKISTKLMIYHFQLTMLKKLPEKFTHSIVGPSSMH